MLNRLINFPWGNEAEAGVLKRLQEWALSNPAEAVTTVAFVIGAPFVAFVWWRKNLRTAPVKETPPPAVAVSFGIAEYEQQVRIRIAEAMEARDKAEGAEREQLNGQLAELNGKLENIEPAFEAAKERIAELEQRLERMGNRIGGDRLAEARAALEKGDFSIAEDIFEEVEARAQIEVENAAEAAYGLGEIAEERVKWHEAAEHYARAARLSPNFNRLKKARTFAWRAGDYAKATLFGEDLIETARTEFAEDAPEFATALNDQALGLKAQSRYEEAEPLYRQAIEIDKATIGEAHPHYAIRLNNLANLLRDMGRLEEAEPLYRQAIEITNSALGEAHPKYAIRLGNLAALLRDMGRYEEAEPLFRQAIEIDKATIGEGHPDYAARLNNLANLLSDMGKPDEARPLWEQMHAIHLEHLGLDHPQTKKGAQNYAKLLCEHFPNDPTLKELEATLGPDIGK